MIQELIQEVGKQKKEYGGELQPAATRRDLEWLKKYAKQELKYSVPDQYLDLLLITNGMNFNGLYIYASERSPIVGRSNSFIDGFVEFNLGNREDDVWSDFLIFAEDGCAHYAYHPDSSEYQSLVIGTETVLDSFRTFDELICDALRHCLGIFDDEEDE